MGEVPVIALSLTKATQSQGRYLLLTHEQQGHPSPGMGKGNQRFIAKPRVFGKLPNQPLWFELDPNNGGQCIRSYPDHKGTGKIVQSLLDAYELARKDAADELQQAAAQVAQTPQNLPGLQALASHLRAQAAQKPAKTPGKQQQKQQLVDDKSAGSFFIDMIEGVGIGPQQAPENPDDEAEALAGYPDHSAPPAPRQRAAPELPLNLDQADADMAALELELADLELHFDKARAATGGQL